MLFDDLFSRADLQLLQDLVGSQVVELLGAVRPKLLSAPTLRQALLELRTPAAILGDRRARRLLFELLRPAEAEELAQLIDVSGDPYRGLASADFGRASRKFALLLSFFGLPIPPESTYEEVPDAQALAGGYELFPHQRTAVIQAGIYLRDMPYRAVLHMPTGAGKTRTAMSLVCNHLREQPTAVVLWLAASEELCDQAVDEFSKAWRNIGDRSISVRRAWGPHPLPSTISRDEFIVGGLAKLFVRAREDPPWIARLGDVTSLIVFDEAHQAIAPTYRHVVQALAARRFDTAVLGLTATPGRTWNDVDADRELAEFFGRRKVALHVEGFDNPVTYLIENGYLARPTFVSVANAGPELTSAEIRTLQDELEVPKSVLDRLGTSRARNLVIADQITKLAGRHKRVIVFCATVESARVLAVIVRALGVDARAVTGDDPAEERAAAITWYKERDDSVRVLLNFGVLTTGFDAPRTSAALIARPTKSLVLFSQMVGRAIRGPKAGGNAEAEIVTIVDTNLPGFRSVAESYTNWEDVWDPETT